MRISNRLWGYETHPRTVYVRVSATARQRIWLLSRIPCYIYHQVHCTQLVQAFLVRTLVDWRYFHGIRTMDTHALARQANIRGFLMLGLRQHWYDLTSEAA
jgi:transcription initiation factor TFIID subunit 2